MDRKKMNEAIKASRNALKCDLPNVSDLLGCGYCEKDETDY